MSNASEKPGKDDAILGGAAPTPANAVVLGGIEAVEKGLASSNEAEQVAALENALKYGNVGLDIVIGALKDDRPAVELKAWELLRDREEKKVTKALKDYESLRSSCGVSYKKLQQLLAEGNWQKADRETKRLLLGMVKRRDLWLREQDIKKLPGLDLRTCDRLWFNYSKGHFGFRVQAKILTDSTFAGFADNIGWKVTNEMGGRGAWDSVDRIYRQKNTPFDLTAPQGHLPLVFELGGGKSKSRPYTTDTESVMGFSSIDGYYNEWSSNSFFGPKMVKCFLAHFCQHSG